MEHVFKKLPVAIATGMIALTLPGVANAFTLSPTAGSYDEAMNGDLSDDRLMPTDLGSLIGGVNNLKATFFKATDDQGTDDPDDDLVIGLDYFTFEVLEGQELEAIVLNDWTVPDEFEFEDIAFTAIKEGSVFDYDLAASPSEARATGLLGWSHWRSPQVGTAKILEEMATSDMDVLDEGYFQEELATDPYAGLDDKETLEANLLALAGKWEAGALGFDLPLEAGIYSMWLRQGSPTQISVDLDFITSEVAPPPPQGEVAPPPPQSNDPASVPEPSSIFGTTLAFGLATLLNKKRKRS